MNEPILEPVEGSSVVVPGRLTLERVRRPRGLYVIPPILLLAGAFLAFHHLRVFDAALTSEEGPTTFSSAYLFNAFGEMLLALTAIIGGLTLFFGAKMGWWLTALYLPWTLARETVIPYSLSNESFAAEAWASAAIRTLILSVMFLYLFRWKVLEFVGLTRLLRLLTGVALVLNAFVIAYLLDWRNGLFSFSNEVPLLP